MGFIADYKIKVEVGQVGERFDYFFVVCYEDLVGAAELEVAEVGVCIEDEDSDTFFA